MTAPPEPAGDPDAAHAHAPLSDWVVRWAPLLLPAGARVLDVACGHGRHVSWLAAAGHRVTAVDRDPALLGAVAPGGLLVYETFGAAQAALGRPRRPDFLLQPGELLERLGAGRADAAWRVIAFEEGRLPARGAAPERAVQRIVARRLVNSSQSSPAAPDLLAPPG